MIRIFRRINDDKQETSESWGCEFLDLDDGAWYGLPRKPWKIYEDAVELPIELVLAIADKNYMKEIKWPHREKLNNLKMSILDTGLRNPAKIKIAPNIVSLTDGHHRLIAFQQLGFQSFPVQFSSTKRSLKSPGLPPSEFIPLLANMLDSADEGHYDRRHARLYGM